MTATFARVFSDSTESTRMTIETFLFVRAVAKKRQASPPLFSGCRQRSPPVQEMFQLSPSRTTDGFVTPRLYIESLSPGLPPVMSGKAWSLAFEWSAGRRQHHASASS